MKTPPGFSKPKGFALVVTLSLMILLTIIAVGLLTLSSISLRTAAQSGAMATAQANARLALMLAIGDLQKSLGPDKAITANSEIGAANSQKRNLTGVWDSWDIDVSSSSLDYDSPKTQQSQSGANPVPGFKKWLVSERNPMETASRDYSNSPFSGESVELVGEGSLGKNVDAGDKIRAGKVPVTRDGQQTGSFAWHVADESVKARINTYRDSSGNQTLSQKRALLAGHRPDVSVMKNSSNANLGFLPNDLTPEKYGEALATTGKIVSLNQAELFDNTPVIKTFRHDVTPYSLGLLTNVREGGFKQDLSSLFELTSNGSSGVSGFPSELVGKKLYETNVFSGGASVTGVSDPYWSVLAGYYNTYKELQNPETRPTLVKIPPQDISLSQITQPQQYSPAPVIAKVELLFSLLARDKHGPWKNPTPPADYMVHVLYTPIFTLHNPYNVNLQFDRMKIGMSDVPMGFTFYRNGAAQNNLTPLSQLFVSKGGRKDFWMELADWPSATATNPTGPIIMKPGETMVFGPYIDAKEPFGDNNASYFDYGNNKTGTEANPLKSKRGFSGPNIGFDIDWLKGGILYVDKADKLAVEFKCLAAPSAPVFRVNASLTVRGVTRTFGGMSFNYGSQTVIDKILPGTLRYPKTDGIFAESMHASNSLPIGGITTAKAFALFSAYARTANGGVDDNGRRNHLAGAKTALPDGRLAGNPFLHHNAARVVISSDLTMERPACQSHELNLVALNGETNDTFNIAADFRTNYLFNYKQVANKSIKSGSYLEIPSGPLQAIADFRRSNILSSPYLPAFVQPVGNSYASPLIATDSTAQSGVTSYQLLDHSVLANHALYDSSYFSTFAPVGSQSAVDGFQAFMAENKPLRNQVFQPNLPVGRTVEDVRSELFADDMPTATAYKLAAQYQMVKAPFNVNSTRVQAWKAVLSSMNNTTLNTLWAKSGLMETKAAGAVPIPAMTLHNGTSTTGTVAAANIDDQACNEWNGFREFSGDDIDKLATEIVKQVKLRGPFQSMSEFVNRRIGSDSDLTRKGALQNAIDDAKLNYTALSTQTVEVKEAHVSNPNLYGFKTPIAATGNPAAGAPGWLSQADLLKALEPAATVRSDTFVIRTCGEATDKNGLVVARAYAEAVVQRIPEYVNPADPPAARPSRLSGTTDSATPLLAAAENIAFGRRFVIVSFKWLSSNEI